GQIVYSLPAAPASRAQAPRRDSWSLIETAVGGKAHPIGANATSTGVSYFVGNDPSRWKSGLSTFESISLGEVWPGIRLDLRAHGKNVEKLFTVGPSRDPSRIRMNVAGARRLGVNEAGALVVETGLGAITFTSPRAFQERDGVRHSVTARYEVHGRQYGFRLDGYDRTLPVVIDSLLQATYLGGPLTSY